MTRPGSTAQKGTATVLALWLAIFGAMAVWIAAQRATDRVRVTWPDAYPLLFLPQGRYLAYASLGFRVMLADTIYLWSIQYYGHRRTVEGRNYLWQIYTTIADLDPQFIDAYTTGALVMAIDMSDPALAVELLDLGIERNPDTWLLPAEAGWYCYLNLGEPARAQRYFELAMKQPDAPSYLPRLRAQMAVDRGDLLSAIVLWEQIRDEAEASGDEYVAGIAGQRVPDLYSQWAIGELDKAIAAFAQEEGRKPDSLALLARLGRLPGQMIVDDEDRPLNYFGEPFNYDARTGEVTDPRAEQARTGR